MIGKWCALNNALKPKELEKPKIMAKRKEDSDSSNKKEQQESNKHWTLEELSKIRGRWKRQDEKLKDISKKIDPILRKLTRFIGRMIIIGIICNIIASSLWPEFPKEHPAIFGWFDGWLQFGEFLYKAFFKGIYAIFTGNFKGFIIEFAEEAKELFHQFVNWLSMLKF